MLLQKLSMYLDLVMVVVTVVIVTLVIVTLSGFALGSTIESKTKGIWMWCVPHPNQAGGHASLTHTQTHTHTHSQREREREREMQNILSLLRVKKVTRANLIDLSACCPSIIDQRALYLYTQRSCIQSQSATVRPDTHTHD